MTPHDHEVAILNRLAERYAAQGYAVEVDVALDGSPLRADLVARRGNEVTLVEVKSTESRVESRSLRALAEYAASRDWTFSIVLARPDGVEEVQMPTLAHVRRLIADAATVDSQSWLAPIAVVAAFEAAARYALLRTERRALPKMSPLAHLQAVASSGLVSPQDERVLRELIAARNEAAHGVERQPVPRDTVAAALRIATELTGNEVAAA